MGKRSRKRSTPRDAVRPAPVLATSAQAAPTRLDRTKLGDRAAHRPKPPWAPLPVSEGFLALGFLLLIFGYARGPDRGAPVMMAGVLFVAAGAAELCAREHFSGYRSHVLFLALLPVSVVHTLLRVVLGPTWDGPHTVLVDAVAFAAFAAFLLLRFRRMRSPGPRG